MTDEFDGFKFGLCRALYGDEFVPQSMAKLVDRWIWEHQQDSAFWERQEYSKDGEKKWAGMCEWNLVQKAPDVGWKFILSVLAAHPDEESLGLLAAGPLENLLAFHGPHVIDRIEEEARRSPGFRTLLRGVWQNRTPDEVWQRVLTARLKGDSRNRSN